MPDGSRVLAGIRRVVGPVYRGLRSLPERLLHRPRHRAAVSRLARLGDVEEVLVVCHGNVCRSPYLEVLLRKVLPGSTVHSAGFVGPGRGVPTFAALVAEARGHDLSAHRSRIVTHEMIAAAELVLVMDEHQADELVLRYRASAERVVVAGDLDPAAMSLRRVADPWGKPREAFEASYARLERIAATLSAHLTGR